MEGYKSFGGSKQKDFYKTPTINTYMREYDKVIQTVKRAGILNSAKRALFWDQRTMMPPNAKHIRSMENVALATAIHRTLTSSYLGKHIKNANQEELTEQEKANLQEIKKDYYHKRRITQSQITDIEKLKIQTMKSWSRALKENDFNICKEDFSQLIAEYRKYGKKLNKENPYQGLLSEHEPDISLEEIKKLFTSIKRKLSKKLKTYHVKEKNNLEKIKVPKETKIQFNKYFAQKIGFDFSRGRLDYATKAFSGAYGRICIAERTWISELKTLLHEAGHSMYELGLPDIHYGTPLAQYRSTTLDESQSLIWERFIGKEKSFWDFFVPKLQQQYEENITSKKILNYYNHINKSLRRGGADEITYLFHIILRFELEEGLINGNIQIDNLEKEWEEKCLQYFGKKPSNLQEGLLQDVHWSKGSFGYFPCYVLGAILAAQIYEQMCKQLEVQNILKNGEMIKLRDWLHKEVHQHGRQYSAQQLLKKITGSPEIKIKPFFNHLEACFPKFFK
jgi:carboxypeptidase Taq